MEDEVSDISLQILEEPEVLACLVLTPLGVHRLIHLSDVFELHEEKLLKVRVNKPLAQSLVEEVERSFLIFFLPLLRLLPLLPAIANLIIYLTPSPFIFLACFAKLADLDPFCFLLKRRER